MQDFTIPTEVAKADILLWKTNGFVFVPRSPSNPQSGLLELIYAYGQKSLCLYLDLKQETETT